VIAFFALTLGFSWSIWFLSPLVAAGDLPAQIVIDLIGAFGPAMAAVVISAVIHPEKVNSPRTRGRSVCHGGEDDPHS